MKQNIIIVGAGGFGRELFEMLWDAYDKNAYQFKGFLAQDDRSLREAGLDAPYRYKIRYGVAHLGLRARPPPLRRSCSF